MKKTKNNVRLNNFILWCKGWYIQFPIKYKTYDEYISSKDKDRTEFEDVKRILKLDGYEYVRTESEVLCILLNFIDELIDNGVLSGKNELRMVNWNSNLQKYINLTKDYNRALLLTIRDLFAYSVCRDDLKLNPPIYNRKVYKLGFVGPVHLGNSYKMLNCKAKRFFES